MTVIAAPVLVHGSLILADGPISHSRGRRSLKRALGQRHVLFSNMERGRFGEGSLGGFNITKKFFKRLKMPDRLAVALFNRNYAQQAVTALELEDQIVTGLELVAHGVKLAVTLPDYN